MANTDLHNNPFVPPKDARCIINELPSELLSHIFTLGWTPERDNVPDEDDFEDVESDSDNDSCSSSSSSASGSSRRGKDEEDARSRKLSFNVLVSHVCERWRAISLDNPLLWNHIQFTGDPLYERAMEYLNRAKDVPLEITVDRSVEDDEEYSVSDDDDEDGPLRRKDNDSELSVMTEIMDQVVPHISHCRALEIVVSFYPHMHRALEMLGGCPSAPILEVLQLYHHESTDEHITFPHPSLREQPFKLFHGNAPRLITVALWGVHLPWNKDGVPFLTGLTDLELAYHACDVRPSFSDFARILRSSPDLRSLTLSLSCPAGTPNDWPSSGFPLPEEEGCTPMSVDTTGADPRAPLTLRRLHELMLAYLEPSVVMSLLPRLRLPALTSLTLDLEDDDYSEVLAYLASTRSLPPPPDAGPLLLRGPGVAGGVQPRSLLSNLTALKVSDLQCQDGLVLDAYRQLTRLSALNLNMLYLAEPWLELLFPQDAGKASVEGAAGTNATTELLLPRLEHLTTTGVGGDRIRELVEAREVRGAPLKMVQMNEDDEIDHEDELWLTAHLERFEFFEGSDDEELELVDEMDDFDDGFGTDEEGWEDEDDDDMDSDADEFYTVHPF